MKTTQKRFWEVLATCRGFKVREYDEAIRTKTGECPVCAVHNKLKASPSKLTYEYIAAANHLGLNMDFAHQVAGGADGHARSFRKKLLSILKLKEPA